jgi:hypothetical protein
MPSHLPSPPSAIHISIDVSAPLLDALQKLSARETLTREERFEIAGLTFLTARALCYHRRTVR